MPVRVRYEPLFPPPGQECAEANYRPCELAWQMPVAEAALVCIDCWNWHYSRECLERIETCMVEAVAPLLAACREHGMTVIHAPADPLASRHPNWVRLKPEGLVPQDPWPDSPDWPPNAFRQKAGAYARYRRPANPWQAERQEHAHTKRDFHPLAQPVGDEPVVLDGEELHRLCARKGLLHLFFVGFNTNACLMMRTYGIPEMARRGYHVILVRDATTGMEVAETLDDLVCTRGTIKTVEQFLGYTTTSAQLILGLSRMRDTGTEGGTAGSLRR